MSPLEDFFVFNTARQGERLIGVYLYPYRFFGNPDWNDPHSATEVVATMQVDVHEILITRNGGLFLRTPRRFKDTFRDDWNEIADYVPASDRADKFAFEEEAAAAFNRLVCELALLGIITEPATPAHISKADLIDNHALVTAASGSERTEEPMLQLIRGAYLIWSDRAYLQGRPSTPRERRTDLQRIEFLQAEQQMKGVYEVRGTWRSQPQHDMQTLVVACQQERTAVLAEISRLLPTMVAGAYFLASRGQLSEALIDAWVAVEQMIDYLWDGYLRIHSDSDRKSRLKDTRTYTTAVRTEVLQTAGIIDDALYNQLNKARKHRNDLAHRAKVSLPALEDCLQALKTMLELVCERPVKPAAVTTTINW